MGMTTVRLLHRILFDALLEIRVGAHEGDRWQIFRMADLLHHVPLQLDRVARGEISAEDVMQQLRLRAEERGLTFWLDQRMLEASRYLARKDSGTDA